MKKNLEQPDTHWNNTPENPDDWYGFVYEITNLTTGMKYIGRKYFHIYKKGKRFKESNWKNYTSSSKEVNQDIEFYGIEHFRFTIVSYHKGRQEVNYAEVEEQVKRNVLKSILPDGTFEYYNKNIMSKFFRPKDFGTPEYEAKVKSISEAQKRKFLEGYKHPLLGKVHPNKGKKLPQTGHSKNIGKIFINDGITCTSILKGATIPEGWKQGILRSKPVQEYKKYNCICTLCSASFEVGSSRKLNKYCSKECRNKSHSIRMIEKYKKGLLKINT